jgi:hypothetical protein
LREMPPWKSYSLYGLSSWHWFGDYDGSIFSASIYPAN